MVLLTFIEAQTMVAKLLSGKPVAQSLLASIQTDITKRCEQDLPCPTLVVIQVGNNPASSHYIAHKEKACKQVGIESILINLKADVCFDTIKQTIKKYADNPAINGILLQLPLPNRNMEAKLIESIPPEKDVDGFHPFNIGSLALRQPLLRSCTPYGIIQLLQYYDIALKGQNVVIVGASNIVGRPMMLECLNAGATVTVCHRFTKDLAEQIKKSDICIVAVGKQNIIQAEWFKPGVVIVDVGFERDADGNIHGDVPFDQAKETAAWITPVPGGVGQMTVATLMKNTLEATQLQD
jgi:methylenetetrahydrofolate dehydrogenase (NADP+)/methenyltetrahydrofolate cyclohydrolase